jgi:dihydrofolate synthase/folylpolyglutamate synthase
VPASAVRIGVEDVVWPARLERTRIDGIDVLIDGAHNPAGARALAAHILDTFGHPLPFVVGVMHDKAIDGILAALAPAASVFVCTAPDTPRAAGPADVAGAAARSAPAVPAMVAADPMDAVRQAARAGSPVVVAGSLYLAGQIRPEGS